MTTYVAPASRAFTEAHKLPPSASDRDRGGSSGDLRILSGTTACGLEMDPAALWVPVTLRPGDQVCRACLGCPDEQGALL